MRAALNNTTTFLAMREAHEIPAAPVSAQMSAPVPVEIECSIGISLISSGRIVLIVIGRKRTVRELILKIEEQEGLSIRELMVNGQSLDLDMIIDESLLPRANCAIAIDGPRPPVSVVPVIRMGATRAASSAPVTVTASAASSVTPPAPRLTTINPAYIRLSLFSHGLQEQAQRLVEDNCSATIDVQKSGRTPRN